MDHDELVKSVESSFLSWETSYGKEILEMDLLTPDDSTPVYYGGEITVCLWLLSLLLHALLPSYVALV